LATLLLTRTLTLAELIAARLLTARLALTLLLSTLLATLALLPLLAGLLTLLLALSWLLALSLLALLAATLLLALALLALALLPLLTELALLTLLVPTRSALELLSQLLYLVQSLLDAGLRFSFVSRLAHRLFSLVKLIPERLQSHRDGILARPDVSAESAAQPIGPELHAQLQLVLLHLTKGLTNL